MNPTIQRVLVRWILKLDRCGSVDPIANGQRVSRVGLLGSTVSAQRLAKARALIACRRRKYLDP